MLSSPTKCDSLFRRELQLPLHLVLLLLLAFFSSHSQKWHTHSVHWVRKSTLRYHSFTFTSTLFNFFFLFGTVFCYDHIIFASYWIESIYCCYFIYKFVFMLASDFNDKNISLACTNEKKSDYRMKSIGFVSRSIKSAKPMSRQIIEPNWSFCATIQYTIDLVMKNR